ncbi:alpha-tocopherol transfer protein-like [Melitaea cinxia]|uniref:alpha-tocopherol transfer protein-like n=1 Tax=Melitaea cinxia TaxID=113334 RepID=UPI001E27394B|nr:alpha-tocopherol transfer protein-like [Melitaea cinxia]
MPIVKPFPVEKEFEKNPDISPDDIRKLREWLKTQPHLPEEHITDLDLVCTYFCCDKSAEVSKQVLDLHYTVRTLFTQLFKDREVNDAVLRSLSLVLAAPLPMPTVNGYRAIYCRLLDGDVKSFVLSEIIRTVLMVFDLWQYEEGTWPGFVLIIDMELVSLGHLPKLELLTVRQILYFLQECMLIKLKEVHFLNAPSFMDKVMMILRPFMKKSLIDIINIHERASESVYKFLPKASLPKEYGGEYKSIFTIRDETIRRLQDNKQFYIDENKKRVNESVRANGKKKTVEDLFGIHGSFKKLDID